MEVLVEMPTHLLNVHLDLNQLEDNQAQQKKS